MCDERIYRAKRAADLLKKGRDMKLSYLLESVQVSLRSEGHRSDQHVEACVVRAREMEKELRELRGKAAKLEVDLAQWRVFAKGICAAYGIEVPMTTDRHLTILDRVIQAREEADSPPEVGPVEYRVQHRDGMYSVELKVVTEESLQVAIQAIYDFLDQQRRDGSLIMGSEGASFIDPYEPGD